MKRLYLATINSWNGLRAAARSDAAIREELIIIFLAIPAAYFIGITPARRRRSTRTVSSAGI